MIIVKVMVCFLAIFGREDCRLVGGLPVVRSPPDSGQGGAEGTSVGGIGGGGGSNQRIANEPPSATSTTSTAAPALPDATEHQSEKKSNDDGGEESTGEIPGVEKGLEQMKFESKKMSKIGKSPVYPGHRFSSVYRSADGIVERESEKNKSELKRELTAHIAEALREAVERRKIDPISPESVEKLDDDDETSGENRQRKSIKDPALFAAHQQTTNMRPIRKQHNSQGKRNVKGEAVYSGKNRRNFNGAKRVSNGKRDAETRNLELDLSRALYQFGPAQLHALKGVFDKPSPSPSASSPPVKRNFQPIPPKQVVFVPPRIVYETKLIPAPFSAIGTEQKTVEALSALLGRTPAQQLEGLNLILGKNDAQGPKLEEKISPQGPTALRQNFVTPIPPVDINDRLVDGSFGFSNNGDGLIDHEAIPHAGIDNPFENPPPDNHHRQESSHEVVQLPPGNDYRTTIPVVENPRETLPGRPPVVLDQEEPLHVWETAGTGETGFENSDRYPNHKEEREGDSNRGKGYAAKYNFGYHINDYESGNNFGHEEERDGVVTNGRYYVLLPDGRVQNVKYHVDEGGYHAKVSYQLNHSL